MVRKFCSGIYLQLMIVMCFKNHLIFGDDPLFPDGKDFADASRQNVIEGLRAKRAYIAFLADFHFLQDRANFWQTDLF